MDISKASNLERFVFDLVSRDPARTAELFGRRLAEHGYFDLGHDVTFQQQSATYGVVAGSSSHADRLATIRALWEAHGLLIDPHTADGVHVARQLLVSGHAKWPVIAYETALPVKFADTIRQAIGHAPPMPARFAGLQEAPRHVTPMANDVAALKRWLAAWA
jgi:threonine synthase